MNCTTDELVKAGCKDYDNLIDNLNERAPNALKVVSSVIPRADKEDHQKRVDIFNQHLQSTTQKGCIVVDNYANFKLRNDKADTNTLHQDKLHLSRAGTSRLVKNINAHVAIVKKQAVKTTEPSSGNHRGHAHDSSKHRQ